MASDYRIKQHRSRTSFHKWHVPEVHRLERALRGMMGSTNVSWNPGALQQRPLEGTEIWFTTQSTSCQSRAGGPEPRSKQG